MWKTKTIKTLTWQITTAFSTSICWYLVTILKEVKSMGVISNVPLPLTKAAWKLKSLQALLCNVQLTATLLLYYMEYNYNIYYNNNNSQILIMPLKYLVLALLPPHLIFCKQADRLIKTYLDLRYLLAVIKVLLSGDNFFNSVWTWKVCVLRLMSNF